MDADPRAWKQLIRARLAKERSALLVSLLGLSHQTLESEVVAEGLTATQALFLIANLDRLRAYAIEDVLAGRAPASGATRPAQRTGSFAAALAAALLWRSSLLSALARVPDDDVLSPRFGGGRITLWMEESLEHDRISADRFSEWRASRARDSHALPQDLLLAAIRAARKELLTAIALVPEHTRPGWLLGPGSLKQALDDVITRERQVLESLPGSQADRLPKMQDSWHVTWRALHDGHHALVRRVESLSDGDLEQQAPGPRLPSRTLYDALRQIVDMDRHIAAAVRGSLEITPPASTAAP